MIARDTIVVSCASRSTLVEISFANEVFGGDWPALLFIPRIYFFRYPSYNQ
jgi:hypothetical protein